jgi:hypothetical protein
MLGNIPGVGRVVNVIFCKAVVKCGKGIPVFNSAPCCEMGSTHFILKMEAVHSFETCVNSYWTTHHHIPEDRVQK